ncbi:hypothetical protein ACU686_04370 [Yinghuangia aomiensis]
MTRKSVLMTGSVGRNPVVVKYLTDDSPAWTQRLRHEISAYRTFTRQRPPVRGAAAVRRGSGAPGAGPRARAGRPAAVERHPGSALARADVRSVLHAFGALNAWKPPSDRSRPRSTTLPRVQRYHALGC